MRRLWTLALGELTHLPAPRRDDRQLALIGLAACMAFFLADEHPARGGPMIYGVWRMLMFGGIPLAAIALWSALAEKGSRLGAAAAGLLLSVPILVRLTGKATVFTDQPALLGCGVAAMAVAVLVAARSETRLSDWGLSLGDWRWWLPRTAVFAALLVGGAALVMHLSPDMVRFYPAYKPARTDVTMLAIKQLSLTLDFVGWEFLFRGFLLFGVARRGDTWAAIWLQAIPFFLLHNHKPGVELLLSLPGGLIAGWFCLRARSFLPLFLLHSIQMGAVNGTAFLIRNG